MSPLLATRRLLARLDLGAVAGDAGNAIGGVASNAAPVVAQGGGDVVNKVAEGGGDAVNKVADTGQGIGDTVNGAKGMADDAMAMKNWWDQNKDMVMTVFYCIVALFIFMILFMLWQCASQWYGCAKCAGKGVYKGSKGIYKGSKVAYKGGKNVVGHIKERHHERHAHKKEEGDEEGKGRNKGEGADDGSMNTTQMKQIEPA